MHLSSKPLSSESLCTSNNKDMFKKSFLILPESEPILKLVADSVTELLMTGLSKPHAYTFTHYYVNTHTHTHTHIRIKTHTQPTTLIGTGNINNFRSRKSVSNRIHREECSFRHTRKIA
jgi:hypothetical protein